MSQVNNVIDNLSHNTSLIKEIAGKGIAEKAEIAIRETRNIANDYLSKNASDAIKASITPQIKNAKPVSAEATVNRTGFNPSKTFGCNYVQKCARIVQKMSKKVQEKSLLE